MSKERINHLKQLGFWALLREFCLESTIVGLKYFYLYPDRLSRCFWAITMISSVTLSATLSRLLYRRFDEMPTRITIENQYAPVTDLPWPAITICSPNQLTHSHVEHFRKTLVDGNLTLDLETAVKQLLGFYEILPDPDIDMMNHLQNLVFGNRHVVPELMAALPQTCDEFLRFCILQNSILNCSELFKPILTIHGLCCVFNSPFYHRRLMNEKKQHFIPLKPDVGNTYEQQLTVVTDYEPSNALDGTLLAVGSVRIMIHDHEVLPADDESFLLYCNTESFHSIYGTVTYCSDEVKALPPESRRCRFVHEHQYVWDKAMGFRNSDCDLMCFAKAVYRHCHCWLFYIWADFLRVSGYHFCNITSIPCIIKTKETYTEISQQESCDCARDCDSREYKSHMNIGNLGAIEHLVNNHYGHLQINKSSCLMHFFFGNPFYVVQKQETVMSLINLASNLGGVFGLCMGCSIFSVLEIFFFIYKAISNSIYQRRLKKKVLQSNG